MRNWLIMMERVKETTSTAERRIHEAALRIFARSGRTDLTISELANEAGVARGTVYNYIKPGDDLFDNVTARLTAEMYRRVNKSIATTDTANNPLSRLSIGIRLYIKRAHEDPLWGKFIYSFGFRAKVLQKLWSSNPTEDLLAGVQNGQIHAHPERLRSTMSFIAGVVSGAIYLVATGRDTWRNAGSHAVEFVLRALEVPSDTITALANQDLPPLLPDE